ncbi:MAG: [FeFe] hydrogenase, group A [Fibromonadaceae bacterium]|jgi:ferredoxin hydrogenase|nr:[FeFe] hydrogenase, group A [Fibromonadaceae bacterium]
MAKVENWLTRREFLKKSAVFGAGLLVCSVQVGHARQCKRGRGRDRALPIHSDNPAIQLHQNRCRNCGDCQKFCSNTMGVFGRNVPSGEEACIYCGQCTLLCPRAISEQYHYSAVAKAIADPGKIVIASTAPAIRVALGEMYKLAPGTNVEGKIVASLKKLGVNYVLDTTFSADLTVMEEAAELLLRLENNDAKNPLPMFTSCCPAWVRFVKLFYPNLLPNFSTAKSPMLMQGTLTKTYFAQKIGIDPAKIVNIALMPCTAKKAEILLPKTRDVDFVLTSRELAYLLNDSKINFLQMQDAPYDSLMGTGSGSGMIFGNSGGVMEAALRTAYKLLNDKNPPDNFFNLSPIRGFDSVRQASVDLGKRTLNVAVVHGVNNARPLLESIQNGTQKLDFVEVMACSGGCIGGGGQPVSKMNAKKLKQLRQQALYQRDASQAIRLSCDNPEIQTIYNEFLGKPLSKKAKELLHVSSH